MNFVLLESSGDASVPGYETGIIEADSFDEAVSFLKELLRVKYPGINVIVDSESARYVYRNPDASLGMEAYRFGAMPNKHAKLLNPSDGIG